MDKVSAFPFVTAREFTKACEFVQPLLPDSILLAGDPASLRITRRLAAAFILNPDRETFQDDTNDNDDDDDDDDDEAVIKQPGNALFVTVQYHVLLSPSYRVPVMYMTATPPLSISQFFDLVVPHQFQDAMRETGVMGALSMTDHPDTGLPAYFVHPCRTADTMGAVAADGLHVRDYMLIWLGIMGASVGLNVSSKDLGLAC